jgi:MFS family permease
VPVKSLLARTEAPFAARALYPIELRSWLFVGFGLGVVESGVAGVVVKSVFTGIVDTVLLNLTVALVTGASAFANIGSSAWAVWASGRDKVRALVQLMIFGGVVLALAGTATRSTGGLVVFVACVFIARVIWSGVVTVRSAIWRANYPRNLRATFTARATIVATASAAFSGVIMGALLQRDPMSFRWTFPVAGILIVLGSLLYTRVRVRRHRSLINAERNSPDLPGWRQIIRILRDDAPYRRYLLCLFVFGSGNLMVAAPLVIIMSEQLNLGELMQVIITASLPLAGLPLSAPFWARWLNRTHILQFRAWHGWVWVGAILVLAIGCAMYSLPLLVAGSTLMGIAFGGGRLVWNIGHNDFAGDDVATHYMGLHVTLTGVRGLFAPFIGVLFYQFLEAADPGLGRYALFLPLVVSAAGSLGFVWLYRTKPGVAAD